MVRGLLARSRLLTGCACAIFAMVTMGAGCSTTTPSVTVSGKTLVVYLSAPANLSSDPEAQDVIDAEKLAFSQLSGMVHGFTVQLRVVKADKVSDNARSAIEDKTSVAYLGEVGPGTSADSIGITNAQDLLQVSPTDTAVELTQATPVIPGAPRDYYQSIDTYGRTFARMVATTRTEAQSLVSNMRRLGVTSVYIKDDGSPYGRAIAHAVSVDAGAMAAKSASGAGAVFYGGSSTSGATAFFNGTVESNPTAKLFAPSALDDDAFAAGLNPAAQRNLHVSAPGFPAASLTTAEQKFVADFRQAYGHLPSSQAIFGYAAMQGVLQALKKSGSGATNRTTVLGNFFPVQNPSSVLGTYRINKTGDICLVSSSACTPPPFVLLTAKAGKLVPTG